MSFSKAKLVRFNDVSTQFTKETKQVSKKAPLSAGNQSPAVSECGSVKSVPASFKTPTQPKKPKTAILTAKLTPKNLCNVDSSALKTKVEECEAKTKYILKLTDELEQLRHEKDQLERQHLKELQELETKTLHLINQKETTERELHETKAAFDKETALLKKNHEYQLGQVVLDYEFKIKDLKESVQETLNRYGALENEKLETEKKVERLQATLNDNQAVNELYMMQCELEKENLQTALEATEKALRQLEDKYEALTKEQGQHGRLDKEINILNEIIEKQRCEIEKLTRNVRTYKLTIANSEKIIVVLKRRLWDSDRDVELLKDDLSRSEMSALACENECVKLKNELDEATEKTHSMSLLYAASVELNQSLVQSISEKAWTNVTSVQPKCPDKIREDICSLLDSHAEVLANMQKKIEQTDEEHDRITRRNKHLEEQLEEEIKQRRLLEEKLERNDESYARLQSLSEAYQTECLEHSDTRRKYIQISGKYDALLQDFEQLQMDANRRTATIKKLKEEKSILESENATYKNKLEELKLKKYKFGAKDKENIASPNRGSPFHGSPLRERN